MPQTNSLPPRPHAPSPAFTVTPTAQALAASTTYPTSPRRPGPDQARGRQRGAVGRPRGRPKSQQVKSEESKPRGILLERGSQGSRVPLRVQLLAGEEGERSLWLSEVGVESEGVRSRIMRLPTVDMPVRRGRDSRKRVREAEDFSKYMTLRRTLGLWTSRFRERYGRAPTLSEVETLYSEEVVNLFKEYLNVRNRLWAMDC